MTNISVSGIRRSGNHAISIWLINHFDEIRFFNNIQNINNPVNYEDYIQYDNHLLKLNMDRHNESDNNTFMPFNLLFGFENHSIDDINKKSDELEINHKILIIRDPINNIASLLKYQGNLIPIPHFRKLWKEYAITAINNNDNDFIIVLYDKWFSDYQYRRNIEHQMRISECDGGLNRIHRTGRGSSFDGLKKQGHAQNMNVHKRWWDYRKNSLYLSILNDDELLDLRHKLFGKLPINLRRRISKSETVSDEQLKNMLNERRNSRRSR